MKKSNSKNVVIIILSIAVVALLFFTIYQNFFSGLNNTPPLEEPDKDLVVTLEDYTAFDFEDVPFKFVVASVKFSSSEPINIELKNLQTNENVVLNSVDQYRKAIEGKGYDLKLMEVVSADLVSLENSLTVNLFIPVKSLNTQSIQLRFSADLQNNYKGNLDPIVIDLSNPTGTPEMLGKVGVDEPDNQNPDGSTSSISFGELTEINSATMFMENSEGQLEIIEYPSVIRIFALPVSISSDEKVGVEVARLTLDDTSEEFYALNNKYVYQFGNNILGDHDFYFDGYLLFEVNMSDPYYFTDEKPYTIEYKLFDQDEWTPVNR